MTARKRVNLKQPDGKCPHCEGPISEVKTGPHAWSAWRCARCSCWWRLDGSILKWGRSCPLLTETPADQSSSRKVRSSSVSGGRSPLAPAAVQVGLWDSANHPGENAPLEVEG